MMYIRDSNIPPVVIMPLKIGRYVINVFPFEKKCAKKIFNLSSLSSIHRGFTRGKIVSIGQYLSELRDRAEGINIVTRESGEILAGGVKLSGICV